ncbi:MAG: hypothetical protein GWN16_01345, partial [Calditrichae bacterium]|nr:hypothetical protein [Calditrichia bacterium]
MNFSWSKSLSQFPKRHPDLVSALILLTALLLIRAISEFNGLYGQDSHEYLRYSQRISKFFFSGPHPGDYHWPINYPLYGALFSLIFQSNMLTLQLISIVSLVLTIIYIRNLLGLVYSISSNYEIYVYLGITVIFSPFFLQSAFLVMSDMLAVFFTTAAIYHILKYARTIERKDFLLVIFFTTSAVMTRYVTIVVLTPALILFATHFFKKFNFTNLLLAILIALVCLSPHILIRGENATNFLENHLLVAWSAKNWFLSEFRNMEGYFNYRIPNLLYGFSNFFYPGFMFFGAPLFLLFRKKDWQSFATILLLASVLVYTLFLAGIPVQNMRFLLLTFPLVIVLMFPPFQRFVEKIIQTKLLLKFVIIAVIPIQAALIYKYSHPIWNLNQLEKNIAETLRDEQARPVYTFAIDVALRSYGVENRLVNLWLNEISRVDSTA